MLSFHEALVDYWNILGLRDAISLTSNKIKIIQNDRFSASKNFVSNKLASFTSSGRKIKYKVITLANQKEQRTKWTSQNSNYMLLTESAGKRVQACHDWLRVPSDWMKKSREFFKLIV